MSRIIAIAPEETASVLPAIKALLGTTGRMIQYFSNGAFILEAPSAFVNDLKAIPGIAAVTDGIIGNISALAPTEELKTLLDGWNHQFDPAFAAARASRPSLWSPGAITHDLIASPSPTASKAMIGGIAVGIVMVDGPAGSVAEFTETERIEATLAILDGWKILTDQSPRNAHLVFVADLRRVRVGLNPASLPPPVPPVPRPTQKEFDDRETPWRDQALAALGYPAGQAGIDAYRSWLMARPWIVGTPTAAVVLFLTRYLTAYFAYAFEFSQRMVINPATTLGRVAATDLDRVMAHETAHLFGAADETDCSLITTHGVHSAVNGNCFPANPLSAPCLMRGNHDTMCVWTRAHLGWSTLV